MDIVYIYRVRSERELFEACEYFLHPDGVSLPFPGWLIRSLA